MQNQALKTSSKTVSLRSAADRKQMILEEALKIASTEGLDGLTIGELAKAVGMSKSGLFAHFKGKDNLQRMVLREASIRFVDVILKPAFKEPRGEPRVRAIFQNWLGFIRDTGLPGGSILIAASSEVDDRPGEIRDYVKELQWDLIRNMKKAADIAVAEKHFRRNLDTELFAWSLYAFVLGYHHFRRLLEDPKAEEHVQQAFERLIQDSKEKEKT